MRTSSSSVSSDLAHRLGERGVSHRRSARSRSSTGGSEGRDQSASGHRLGDLPQGRQNELANVQTERSVPRTKTVTTSRERSGSRGAREDHEAPPVTTLTTPTRVVKTPPTKVRQRLSRTSTPAMAASAASCSVSPMQSPQLVRTPVEKTRPTSPLSEENEEEDEADAQPVAVAAAAAAPVVAATVAARLSATFETTFLFDRADPSRSSSMDDGRSARGTVHVTPTPSTSAASSRRASDVEGSGLPWPRQRALAAAHERHQTWKQLELAEQRRLLEATREEVSGVEAQLVSVKTDKRRLEDKLRGVEELHVLTDMLTEKRIRTEAREAKRETLQNIWQQLQLLCGVPTDQMEVAHEEAQDGRDGDLNRDVHELASDGEELPAPTQVHECDDDVDEAQPEARYSQNERAASPEAFAFPCNRQSMSLVNPHRPARRAGSNPLARSADFDSDDDDDVDDDDGMTPPMEPLGLLSPEDASLACILPRPSGSTSASEHEGRGASASGEEEGEEEGADESGARRSESAAQPVSVQPSATHRCKQEHLRLRRDPSASRARSVSMAGAASVASADTREILGNFLSELLFEIEELAQVCIQVPAPCAKTCVTTARGKGAGRGEAASLKKGFFSFFGGATESHLSAKPLSTALSCARRLESAGWLMEQKLQLLVRELSTEEEEDALRARLVAVLRRQQGLSDSPQRSSEDADKADEVDTAPDVAMADPMLAAASDDISKSLFSSPPSSHDGDDDDEAEEVEEDEEEELGKSGARHASAGLPRPPSHPPRMPPTAPSQSPAGPSGGAASDAHKVSHGELLAAPVGLDALMPSLAYALPRLTTVSRALDLAQSQTQAMYKDAVEAEKQRRRDFIRRLKEVYRTVEAPALRRAIRHLRWTQQTLTDDLIELGVTHLVLEWDVYRPLRHVLSTAETSTAAARTTAALVVDAVSEARVYGGAAPSSAASMAATLARHRRRVTIRIPVSTVIRASLERYQRQRHHQEEEEARTQRADTDAIDAGAQSSSSRPSATHTAEMEDEEAWESARPSSTDAHPALATATAATGGLQTVPPKHVALMGPRASLGSVMRLPSPRASTATTTSNQGGLGPSAVPRVSSTGHSVLLRAPSSSSRASSARASGEVGEEAKTSAMEEEHDGAPLAGPPPPRARSRRRCCYFKKELIERRLRSGHGAVDSMPARHSSASQTGAGSPLQVVRVTYKTSSAASDLGDHDAASGTPREQVVVVEEQETEVAPAKAVAVARQRYHARAGSTAAAAVEEEEDASSEGRLASGALLRLTQASAVVTSPERLELEHAIAAGAVHATVRFCGEAAAQRREAAEDTARRAKEAWQLREALARLEEANFVAAREVEELEAEWSRTVAERQEKLYEARTKVNATKSFFGVLEKERAEWSAILSDLKQIIGPDAVTDEAPPFSSSTVSAPPSLVRRDRRRSS